MMTLETEIAGLRLASTVHGCGTLDVTLSMVTMSEPADDEVIVRIDAAPCRPHWRAHERRFSDVLGRSLPNGWSFGLPNEIYLAEDGRSFDDRGVPPEIVRRVFTDTDLARKYGPSLETAQLVIADGPLPR